MPKISYFWSLLIAIVCSYTDQGAWGPFFASLIFIVIWNEMPAFWETFGFVSKDKYIKAQNKNRKLEKKIISLQEELDLSLKATEVLNSTQRLESKILGQDVVFEAYLFNQSHFREHLSLFMKKKDYAFNIKGEPYRKADAEAEFIKRANSTRKSNSGWRTTLGVDANATKETVETAYKNLVKRYHPDVNKEEGNKDRLVSINLAKEEADKYFS